MTTIQIHFRRLAGGWLAVTGGYVAGLGDDPHWYNYVGLAVAGVGLSLIRAVKKA